LALTEFNGSIVSTAVEQNLLDVTTLKHYATTLFTHNMVAGDEIEVKVYKLDSNSAVMRVYRTKSIKGLQSAPAIFVPFLPATQYRVTIKRLAGTDRTYTWNRYEQ